MWYHVGGRKCKFFVIRHLQKITFYFFHFYSLQMKMSQKQQKLVEQLQREASIKRIKVSEAIQDLRVININVVV